MSHTPQILVVDDEIDLLSFITKLLGVKNYRVSNAATGEDALVLLEENPDFDVILLDIMMPGLDGFEVLEIVKNNPKTRHIKVIMLSANSTVDSKVRAFSLGAADYLVKPFDQGELIARIEMQLKLAESQQLLVESEAKYRAIIDRAYDTIMVFSDFRCIFVNQSVETLLGYAKEDFIGISFEQLFPQEYLPELLDRYRRRVAGETVLSVYTTEMLHQNGQRVAVEISATLTQFAGQNVPLVVVRDFSERRQAQEKINALARFVTEAPNPILRLGADGRLMFSNTTGLDMMELHKQQPASTYAPPHWKTIIREALETNQRLEYEHQTQDHRIFSCTLVPIPKHNYVNVYGTEITERKQYEIALQAAQNKLEQRVAERTAALTKSNLLLQRVVEERKAAEEKIIQYTQDLLTLQYAGAAIASSLDLPYVLKTVTREMVDLLKVEGCAISEWHVESASISLLARHGPENWWTDGPIASYATVRQVLQTREYHQYVGAEAAAIRPNISTILIIPLVFHDHELGCLEIVDSRSERIFANEEISLAQLLSNQAASAIENARLYQQAQQEISERTRMEMALEQERATLARRVEERTAELSRANAQLSRAARLKDEFLASMSHELRTPLNAVLSMSEALQEEVYGQLNDKQQHALNNIETSGRHLLSLINDILDLSKIEAGKFDLQLDTVAVEQLCQASLLFVKQTAHKKGIKVSSSFDSRVKVISADERRLKQILVNLLSNAVKFTPEGGAIGLDVTGDDARQAVSFAVWDTGIGIPNDKLADLFQPFVQLDSKLSRRYAGTGLGLALVQRMVEMHGGSVAVESAPDQGSRFTVWLPWHAQPQPQAAPDPPQHLAPAATPNSSGTILLVEDHEFNLNTLTDYLTKQGFTVITATNGKEAIERAKERIPNLILMDIQMPEMDGLEAIRHLRKDAAFATLPIIALTALAMPGDRERCLAAGANDYMSKPISLRGLTKTINNHLSTTLQG